MIKDVMADAESAWAKRSSTSPRSRHASAPAVLRHRWSSDSGRVLRQPTPLNQLAGISVPEPRLLVIQPWDRGSMAAIEKAIMKSELGLNPTNDGQVIRIAIPP